MNNGLCPDHASCREDLMQQIGKKISLKYFIVSLSLAFTLIIAIAGLVYNAYAERARAIEKTQTTQGKSIQSIDKTVTVIQTKQEVVIKAIEELKSMLEQDRTDEKRRRDEYNSNKWNNKVP